MQNCAFTFGASTSGSAPRLTPLTNGSKPLFSICWAREVFLWPFFFSIQFPEHIFTKDDGALIHPDTSSLHLKTLFAELGFPKSYHLHTLRHFFVSTLLHEGMGKNTVADLAGHGDMSFLERTYRHPQMQRKQEAARRMAECLIPTRSAAQMVS